MYGLISLFSMRRWIGVLFHVLKLKVSIVQCTLSPLYCDCLALVYPKSAKMNARHVSGVKTSSIYLSECASHNNLLHPLMQPLFFRRVAVNIWAASWWGCPLLAVKVPCTSFIYYFQVTLPLNLGERIDISVCCKSVWIDSCFHC